jgi:metallophosphoesterase superfamily enzyme
MKLSRLQKRVYDKLKPDTDVLISDLHAAAYPSSHKDGAEVRAMQMRLGSVIARINEKLDGKKVVPGKVKQTYRLVKVEKAD